MNPNNIVDTISKEIKDISTNLEKQSDNIQQLSQTLTMVNSLKFRVINGITYFDKLLSEKRQLELLNVLRDDSMKKLLSSSTLTKNYLDGVLAEFVIPRETLGNTLKAIYTSEENIRTLISKCKFLNTMGA